VFVAATSAEACCCCCCSSSFSSSKYSSTSLASAPNSQSWCQLPEFHFWLPPQVLCIFYGHRSILTIVSLVKTTMYDLAQLQKHNMSQIWMSSTATAKQI
jgi:hypothetical protein